MCNALEPAWAQSTTPKARVEHACYACGETIPPGHRYHRITGQWDGALETYKHCARCWTMYRALANEIGDEHVELGLDCGETWESVIGEIPDVLAELAFALPGEVTLPEDTG